MKALRTHIAGVDVHKDILAITTMIGAGDQDPVVEHFQCSTMTDDLKAMGLVLLNRGVKDVAMESTGVYWKPVYNVWQPMGLNVMIGNATHMKNVPGRKTDMNDSHWIAQLHRFGLIKPSFVPDSVFQRLRLLSRHRTNLVDDLSRVKNRVEKVLQDGNIKWSSIVSDTFGVAGMKIGFGLALKVSVVAEIFGVTAGIGYIMNYSREILATQMVLVWALVMILVMLAADTLVFDALSRRLSRWR